MCIKHDSTRHIKNVLKRSAARGLMCALVITCQSTNLQFSPAFVLQSHPYKFARALTSDQERGSVQRHRRQHKHCPELLVWRTVLVVSVNGGGPVHAALLNMCWICAGLQSVTRRASEQHRCCQTQSEVNTRHCGNLEEQRGRTQRHLQAAAVLIKSTSVFIRTCYYSNNAMVFYKIL